MMQTIDSRSFRSVVLIFACKLCLLSQSNLAVLPDGKQQLLLRRQVFERAWNSDVFVKKADIPPIATPIEPEDQQGKWAHQTFYWNGISAIWHRQGASENAVLVEGWIVQTLQGPVWNWGLPVELPPATGIVAVSPNRVLFSNSSRPAKDGEFPKIALSWLDLIEGKPRTITQREKRIKDKPALWMEARAVSVNGDFYIFWNDGLIQRLRAESQSIETLVEPALTEIAPDIQFFEVVDKTGSIPQPPKFLGDPLVAPDGKITIPMVIREKVVWDKSALDAMWADLPKATRERMISTNRWPIPENQFVGSDYVPCFLVFDPITKKLTRAAADSLRRITVEQKYTRIRVFPHGESVNPLIVLKDGRYDYLASAFESPNAKPRPSAK